MIRPAALLAALLAFAPLGAQAQNATPAPAPQATSPAQPLPDVVMGDPDAPVTIIEYASMTCPHCASFHNTTFKTLKEEYIDTGKVKFVVREFPFDPLAAAAFMLARCAGEERHYAVVDLLFEQQQVWARPGADHLTELQTLARQAGFTNEQFETCLTDQQLLDGINAVKDQGYAEMNVNSTPTFFINGERLQGAQNIGAFRRVIDPKLEG